ncbi:MBL fold metallo-hydrolase [Serinicoccus chungangensis]|uniref:MBL fold metallo-hydrolase n=1 Tax=Serinicoccus chungangensis TaxID=767452 RepID=A0A0W8I7H6_9MICO|nr:MBL fold metallo-hydrolase [Serinicoccus chungangensis]KUG54399.1 MBL fold metallo-hydrolase [Serinicoccus chungangensis]
MTTPTVLPIETASLGDRSYLVHDGEVAFVVDPQRDIDRVLDLAEQEGVRITHVFETHIHNDYVTGGYQLARRTGADYHVNAQDPVGFERAAISDGDVVEVSPSLRVRAIHTPGHTFTHLSYALEGEHPYVFTGGSLLFGSTGRPDLLGEDHAETLARHQHASAHRLARELPEQAQVMPTHGFGSFCSATQTEGDASTIGQELTQNPVLRQDVEDYVREVLDGLDLFPAYYAHMGPANAKGPEEVSLELPERADKEVLRQRLEAGEWVVDLRHRRAFSAGHVPGTLNIGLDGQFSTWLGWMIPWGTPLTLLGEDPEQVSQAQRELVRIGIDELAGQSTGTPGDWTDAPLATLRQATFADLAQVRHHRPVSVLDVRNPREYAAGHVEGALNIPLGQLARRLAEVPEGEVWVHCAGGYRASVGASVVSASGRTAVAVDDSFDQARPCGLPVVADDA